MIMHDDMYTPNYHIIRDIDDMIIYQDCPVCAQWPTDDPDDPGTDSVAKHRGSKLLEPGSCSLKLGSRGVHLGLFKGCLRL